MPPDDWDPAALRAAREAAGWSVAEAVRQMRRWSPQQLPTTTSLVRSWKRWEKDTNPGRLYRPLLAHLLRGETEPRTVSVATPEIVEAWGHRADAPRQRWDALLGAARRRIDLAACAMLFLPEQHPGLATTVAERCVTTGLKVRAVLLDPDGDEAMRRDALEGLGGTLPARIRTTLHHLADLVEIDGVELRLVDTPLYNAVYRFDDDMLVTPYLRARHGYEHPLLHLRMVSEQGLFAAYAGQFEALWDLADPYRSTARRAS
jgi:uncharacterized protein DUF5919